jgi:hypothetical protein
MNKEKYIAEKVHEFKLISHINNLFTNVIVDIIKYLY